MGLKQGAGRSRALRSIGLYLAVAFGMAWIFWFAGWLITQLPTALLVVYGAFLVATILSTTGAALQSVVVNLVRDLYQNVAGHSRGDHAK